MPKGTQTDLSDRFYSPEEAKDFGLIDEVAAQRPAASNGEAADSRDEGRDAGK